MPTPQPERSPGFLVRPDQPLIGVIVEEGNGQMVRYFTDDSEADAAATPASVQGALSLAGAWKDLGEWEEALEELDRIRHESRPTPPIDL